MYGGVWLVRLMPVLGCVRVRWNLAWCVFGDFNIIRYLAERLGCNSFSLAMFKFLDFIERNFLVDLPLMGVSIRGFETL